MALLLAYEFQAERDSLLNVFKDKAHQIDEPDILDKWAAGDVPLLIGHPASMGHGIDGLQDGGHHICWYSPTWSLELWDQFNRRLYRQGQTKPVYRHVIQTRGAIDQMVMDRLAGRFATQDAVMDALRANLEGTM